MERLVSVIIPMYNSENTIVRAIESVLNQSYKNLEIIIINDGSNDRSKNIVEEYVKRYSKVNIKLINQENAGVSTARNRGITESVGDYIAFLDSDDLWNKNKLSKQIKIMEEHDDIYLLGTLSSNSKNIKGNRKIKDISFKKLLSKNYFITSSVVVRREVFKTLGKFNTKKSYSEDYDLWLRISQQYRTSVFMEKSTFYSMENNGLSSNLFKMQQGEIDNYRNIYKDKKIGSILFVLLIVFSNLKFIRRVLLSSIKLK